MSPSSSSSSDEEDGDARWKAAICSAASVDYIFSTTNGSAQPEKSAVDVSNSSLDDQQEQLQKRAKPQGLKLYQIKAQKFLEEMLDKNLEFVSSQNPDSSDLAQNGASAVRLFRKAPPGIIFDPVDAHPRPTKRPQIIPGKEIDEKSKKFRRQIRYAAVDGADIMVSANDAMQRSLARYEAKDVAAKAAAKREEERVAELKRLRGEKWLPSIAREMQVVKAFKQRS